MKMLKFMLEDCGKINISYLFVPRQGKRMEKHLTSKSYGFFLRIFLSLRHSHSQNLFSFFPSESRKYLSPNSNFLTLRKLHEFRRIYGKFLQSIYFTLKSWKCFIIKFPFNFPSNHFLFGKNILPLEQPRTLRPHSQAAQ